MLKISTLESNSEAELSRIMSVLGCLNHNFRSACGVINAVNSLFFRIMHREAGEIEYDDEAALKFGRNDGGEDETRAEFILLDMMVTSCCGFGFLPVSFCAVFSGIVFLLSASDFGYKKRTFLLFRGNVLISWTG